MLVVSAKRDRIARVSETNANLKILWTLGARVHLKFARHIIPFYAAIVIRPELILFRTLGRKQYKNKLNSEINKYVIP